jgi:hypothetical protein
LIVRTKTYSAKYIGLDVHQATISAIVLDSSGKLVMESILETKAATILQFIHGLRGSLHITFEELVSVGPQEKVRREKLLRALDDATRQYITGTPTRKFDRHSFADR